MFYNHLLIAWRNLLRNKVNSIINVGGLAIGLTCVIFIVLYVQDELSFDRGFALSNRIYQVNLDAYFGGQQFNTSYTPPPVALSMRKEFPEIEDYTRLYQVGNVVVHNDLAGGQAGLAFTEKRLWAVDSNFLQVFDYPMLTGDAGSCLKKYHAIVLTESMGRKYFGSQPAIGRSLRLDTYSSPFVVTAVLKDLPANASLQFDLLMPVQDCPPVKQFSWSWIWSQMDAYVVLNKQTAGNAEALSRLQAKFPALVRRDAAKAFARIGQPFDEFIKKGGKWDFYLQPVRDMHLHSADIGTGFSNLGNIKYVYIFSLIAVFVTLLACINFMNLSTARAVRRAKEVGIRKVLGSLKGQMIRQFLVEALLCAVLAALLALGLVALFMGAFDAMADKALVFSDIFRHGLWLLLLLIVGFTGLLAGSYPAFYLTRFKPVEVLKGGGLFVRSVGTQLIRNGLVVFQFTVSIALIICTLVVYRQLQYMENIDLGFNKDNVLIFPNVEKVAATTDQAYAASSAAGGQETLRQELAGIPGIRSASLSSGTPANDNSDFTDFYVPLTSGVTEPLAKDVTLTSFIVDEHYIPALRMKLIAGRNFSRAFNDSASVIVNEATVKHIGWKDALGKRIRYPGKDDVVFTVIGVVKDFNYQSLKNFVTPFALFHTTSRTYQNAGEYIVASTDGAHTPEVLRQAELVWKRFAPGVPFEYSFLDKNYESLYRNEQRMGSVFSTLTILSIIVACLGLFGLSVYTAERRVKEIGIRKVLGASVPSVVRLLSREFFVLVLLSALIAFPLAWWAMNKWLEDFPYRTPISAWIFILAGMTALLVALLTVSTQALKAAIQNPTESLRGE
jgi:putative ABC transport system permease protein